jgi:hypothetical protein
MGLLDRLLGREDPGRGSGRQAWNGPGQQAGYGPGQQAGPTPRTDDEQAIERYRYLLRTAPPDQVEQAHAEAFAKLTPEQRRQVLADLSAEVPEGERATSDDPRSLARMATRAEMRQPGIMERTLGRGGGGMGMGGLIAGGLLASVAGAFVGTAIADAMFDSNDSGESSEAAADGGGDGDAGGDTGGDAGGDYGGGQDFGGGSDFGGGDFGGGDFGGF